MALFLTAAIFFLRSGARHTTLPLYARDAAGLDPLSTGLLLSFITVMNLLTLWPAGWAVDRSRKAVALGGNLAAALAVLAFGWADTFSGLILVSALFGVTTGICGIPPSVIASDVMPARVRSTGIGIFRMAGDVGFIIGPIISGLTISHVGYQWTFATHAAGVRIVGLMATGGSTNLVLHLPAMARAAGVILDIQDFADSSEVTPLMAKVYPNGLADVNHFHAAGGLGYMIGELLNAGLLHPDTRTVAGEGLELYTQEPKLAEGRVTYANGDSYAGGFESRKRFL